MSEQASIFLRAELRLAAWLERRRHTRRLHRLGGTQRCPWCRQCAQNGDGWSFTPWGKAPTLDVLTCGVCGGTSVWLFAMGMLAMRPLDPPLPDPDFPVSVGLDGQPVRVLP